MYSLFVDRLKYRIGDKPIITGKIYNSDGHEIGGTELAFATLRYINQGFEFLFSESSIELSSDKFTFTFPDVLIERQFGKMYIRVYPVIFGNFELENITSEGEKLLGITVNAGKIPNEGHARIDNEIVEFIKNTGTQIEVIRNRFNSIAGNYLAGNKISFSEGYETCQNNPEVCIEKDY